MHVIRPKSAKGRTRPRVSQVQDDEHAHQRAIFSPHPPHPPPGPRPLSTVIQRSNLFLRPCTARHITENLEEFEKAVDAPTLPLNRYQVLPSIEKKPQEQSNRYLEEKTLRLSLSDNSFLGAQTSQIIPNPRSKTEFQFKTKTKESLGPAGPVKQASDSACQKRETDLLLAVRTPCGQRFKCCFHSTDKLQTVIDAAEAKYGKRYRHTLIETMDVPRQSFTNLTMTFSQCHIINKSVLCISFKDTDLVSKHEG